MTELAEPFAMTQPAISKHLKVLEKAGLVSRRRDAQRRPCRLEADALRQATEWLDAYRRHWAERYERLEHLLDEIQTTEGTTAMSQTATLDVEPVGDRAIRIVRSFRGAPPARVRRPHQARAAAALDGPGHLDAVRVRRSTSARAARSAT